MKAQFAIILSVNYLEAIYDTVIADKSSQIFEQNKLLQKCVISQMRLEKECDFWT